MALIAARRFPTIATQTATSLTGSRRRSATSVVQKTPIPPAAQANSKHSENLRPHATPEIIEIAEAHNNGPAMIPSMSERELPGYLLDLTRLRRFASKSARTIDVDWPRFWRPASTQQVCQNLLDIAAAAYSHIMPLLQDFYTTLSNWPTLSSEDIARSLQSYRLRYDQARELIDKYKAILSGLSGPEYEIQQSCAEPDCPFSPIIEFVNPQMARITAIPDIYICLLAPFVSDTEHAASLRYVSSIYAYLQATPGLQNCCIMPDLFISAFWRAGPERDYFRDSLERRNREFLDCLEQVWATIDVIASSENREVSRVEILGITLEAGRSVQEQGFKLKTKPFWQDVGMLSEAWAVAVGAPNPLTSPYASQAEKESRASFADVSLYHYRLSIFRQTDCKHTGASEKYMSQLKDPTRGRNTALELENRMYDPRLINVSDPYGALGQEDSKSETFIQQFAQNDQDTTETGRIACHIWTNDPDKSRIYYII